MDRDRLADIVYAVRDLPEVDAVYDLGTRACIAVSDERVRSGIAARLTALPPMVVDIQYRPTSERAPIVLSAAELEAARARHDARLKEWRSYSVDIDSKYATRTTTPILIVSAAARVYSDAVVEFAAAPVRTYGTPYAHRVEELVKMYGLSPLYVLDDDLDGARALSTRLKGPIHWISSSAGLKPQVVEAILESAGVPTRRALRHAGAFLGLRVLVVDLYDGALDREAQHAAPGARFERAIGWDALDRIAESELDLVIAGEPRDISLSSLARFVQRCKTTPLLVIASDRLTTERMRSKYPKLARYFVERPLCAEDLLRALRR